MMNPVTVGEPRYRSANFDSEPQPNLEERLRGRLNNKSRAAVLGANVANGIKRIFLPPGAAADGSTWVTSLGAASFTGYWVLVVGTHSYTLDLIRKQGMGSNHGFVNDVAHHVTLRLTKSALPDGYFNEACRQRLDGYQGDHDVREWLSQTSDRVMTQVIQDAGGLGTARRMYEGNALDGQNFALTRELGSNNEIEMYRRNNPSFRERYNNDMAFHHGVRAGVWSYR